MRPQSIVMFDRIFLAMIAMGVVNTALNWHRIADPLHANPLVANFALPAIIGGIVLSVGINALFYYFIAYRGSNVARWIWTVLIVINVPLALIANLNGHGAIAQGPLNAAVFILNTLLQIAATVLLFRADARAWFAGRGASVDPDVFG